MDRNHRDVQSGSARPSATTARTWWATAIAAALMLAGLFVGRARDRRLPAVKDQHSQPALRAPHAMVVVTDEGKSFHVPGCSFIHGKRRLVTIEEAVREGFVPCVRCEHDLLTGRPPAAAHAVHATT